MDGLEHFETDYDLAEYLFNLLVDRATGGYGDENHYKYLRKYFLDKTRTNKLVPRWVRVNRDISQYWQFIKNKFPTYAERREFIKNEFDSLLDLLESKEAFPAQESISEVLSNFDEAGINEAWSIALERKVTDPEGAITISRTILESVCKYILDEHNVEYDGNKIELPDLYKKKLQIH